MTQAPHDPARTGADATQRATPPFEGLPRPVPDPFAGRFGALLLPAIILQSVLIGGGYATGREIVEYGARFGARGWIAVLAIFVGFSLTAFLTFEVARVFRAYSYKNFIRRLIGPLWPAFDLLFLAMATLIIAVMASAAASIMRDTLGIPELVGTVAIILAVGVLTFYGARVIEAFKSVGTVALYLAYLAFGVIVLAARGDRTLEVLRAGASEYADDLGTAVVVGTGILYVAYNLAVYPAVLFTLHRQTRRRETLAAGVLSGLLMTLPFTLTWLCVLAFYPDPAVLDAPVPWLPMLEAVGGPWILVVFGVVAGWTLLETSVGLIHALVHRVDDDLREMAARLDDHGEAPDAGLSRLQRGLLGAGILLLAMLLSRIGIITLVARGYSLMGYFFIALFALPLLTVGSWRVWRAGGGRG